MTRQQLNRICGIAPIVMSILALSIALAAGVFGWERGHTDEGSLAHVFQLLIIAQVPLVTVFLVTADWTLLGRFARTIAIQVLAVILAFAPVAYFKL
ncbi:MAG: hypothetical protein ACREHF_15460 [Rhizomicrobium sp.]